MTSHHGKDFFLGAIVGSTLGALTATMFTTEKGHKLQQQLIKKYREFEKMVKSRAVKTRKKARAKVKKYIRKADLQIQKAAKKIHKKA